MLEGRNGQIYSFKEPTLAGSLLGVDPLSMASILSVFFFFLDMTLNALLMTLLVINHSEVVFFVFWLETINEAETGFF